MADKLSRAATSLDGLIRRLGTQSAPPKRLLVDDVRKVWIDDRAPLPDLDPDALYHVTHPAAAKAIIQSGVLRPNFGPQKWGGGVTGNSQGRVFLTGAEGVGPWVDIIGRQALPHVMDDVPEKLALLQFRNARAAEGLPLKPDASGMPHWTQEWAPQLYEDLPGYRDARAPAFYMQGAVPVVSPPRVQRAVRHYSLLGPAAAGAMGLEQ